MPTPRHITSISGQTAAPATERTRSSGGWISGQIASATGDLSGSYRVALDTGPQVSANDATGAALSTGVLVWVVNAGAEYVIVGLR